MERVKFPLTNEDFTDQFTISFFERISASAGLKKTQNCTDPVDLLSLPVNGQILSLPARSEPCLNCQQHGVRAALIFF